MKNILATLLIVSVIVGCVHEIDDLTFTTLKPSISFPLGKISMNAGKLTQLGDSVNVRQGESNVIELYYEAEMLNTTLDDRFTINDQSFTDEIPFSSFLFTAGQTNEVKLSAYNSFSISNSDLPDPAPELTLVELKGGNISITQSKDFSHEVETVITLPKLTKDGEPLTLTVLNNAVVSEDLNGYELDLTGASGTEVNVIDYEISTMVTESGSSTLGTISFSFNMGSMKFSYFEGNFLQYVFDEISTEFDLGLPENEVPDNIRFTNPRIKLIANNSSGIDYELDITEVSVIENNGDTLAITGTYDDEAFILQRADQRGETISSEHVISNDNTDNLSELFSNIPVGAYSRGVVSANPNGVLPQGNFVSDDSRVVINAEITLPLEGYANNYAINDTIKNIDLEFDDDGVINLDHINMRFKIENSFPFDVRLQLYFLEENNEVIDSLFIGIDDSSIIPAGTIDESGLVTSSNSKISDVVLSHEKYEKVKFAKSIRIKASLLTTGVDQNPPKTVKVTTDNNLSIDLGLSGNAIIDLNKLDNN